MSRSDKREPSSKGTQQKHPPRDYEVGWGKPPKHSQFKKGNSGNPSGLRKNKKRKLPSLLELSTRVLMQPVTVKKNGLNEDVPAIEAVLQTRLAMALKGDRQMIRACCEEARDAGLLKDPKLIMLADLLSPEFLGRLDDKQIIELGKILKTGFRSAAGLPEKALTPEQQENLECTRRSKFYVRVVRGERDITVHSAGTAKEALEIVNRPEVQAFPFEIQTSGQTMTKDELRVLAKFEVA